MPANSDKKGSYDPSNRNVFLETTPPGEALKKWLDRINPEPLEGENIRVIDSLGRVTAGPVTARLSSPFFHSAAMDGYAVRFTDTFGALETAPKRLRIDEQAFYINTGDPMPLGLNAVIMIEDVNTVEGEIEIISPVTPWQNVRTVGEDIVATELILPENHRIRPVDVGAMLAGGHTEVSVRRRPVVVVIPTGSEMVEPGTELKEGNIIEYNSGVLAGLVSEWGGEPIRAGIVPDRPDKLKEAVLEALEKADLVVINAGASAGSKDYTAEVISGLGEVILHGLSIKPGKPTIFGFINGKPVLGVPGYPVSAYLVFSLFAKPVIKQWQGEATAPGDWPAGRSEMSLTPLQVGHERIRVKLSRQVASQLGQEEFLRMKIGKVRDSFTATPLGRGAGLLMSLVRADGILRIPAMSEGIGAGTEVEVELLRSKTEIENTLVLIGSHDNTLDLLANTLKKVFPKLSLSSAHVGSMAGLIALKNSEAHIAPTHLLDEQTGQYNVPFIKRLLPDKNIVLVNLVYRQQGLMVRKGNPKNIGGFNDLSRDDITFINRQRGAGTRLLLDKRLKELGIDPVEIKGYEREEYTHMAVASAVLTGVADTGLGILGAANALGLDFIPVAKERYDLAIPEEFIETWTVQALLSIIRDNREFKEAVVAVGGYDTSDMGKVVYTG